MSSHVPQRGSDRDPLIGVAQAAALLGVHPNTLRGWTEAGRLPAFRINARGDRRYRRRDVERLLAEGGTAPVETHAPRSGPSEAEIAVLARIAQGVAPSATPKAVARNAIEALRTHLGVERAAVYLLADGRDAPARLETHAGYEAAPPRALAVAAQEGRLSPSDEADAGAGARRLVALRTGGQEVGVLVLEDPADGSLSRLREPFLHLVGGVLATGLGTARVLAGARREVARARALRHVTQEVTGQLDLNAVLDDIIDRTRSLFDVQRAGLWLLEDSERPFRPAAIRGLSDEFQAQVAELTLDSDSIGVRAAKERRSVVAREADVRPDVGVLQAVYRRQGIKTACLVPLVNNDRAVGVMGLYDRRDRPWPEEELALVQSFANQAAVAISNAQLYRSVADQAARMQSIQDLSARLNRLTDVQAIADAIVAEASTLAAFHDIRVYIVDWETRTCEPIAFTDRLLGDGDFREALRVPVGSGSFTGWVAEHGEAILANDALTDPRGLTIEGTDEISESMLVVPMLFEGRAVGTIALSKLGVNQFSTDDLQTMTIFAGYAAQAVANATAYERLQLQSAELARQLQSQRRLLEINERLLSTLDHGDVLETIADGLRAVVAYDNLSIYRADDVNQALVPVLTRERHAAEVMRYIVPFGRGLMGWAVEHGEPVLANDALNDPRAMQIPGTPADPEALIVVPLVAEGAVIGCMNISRVGGQEAHFSHADFELVKLFAGQASIALRNAEEHRAVSVRADTDALTGLGNHGAFQRRLGELLARSSHARRRREGATASEGQPVALLMMDLDRFKAYNDRLGHPAGDALLQAAGGAIRAASRAEDLAYRYGGDEFALILPGVAARDAAAVGERVRAAVARLTAGEASQVTISVGVAAHPDDAADKNDLIAAADTALYYGKQSGGDRVVRPEDVSPDMRQLRATVDRLARAALRQPDAAEGVEVLVEEAARLTGGSTGGRSTAGAITPAGGGVVRDALLAVTRSLEARDGETAGHGDRVGRLARRVAERLGCPADLADTIELAARLHGLDVLGAKELAPVHSLREIAEIVEWRRIEAQGGEAPLGAQVVAVTNAYDSLLNEGRSPAAILRRLEERAGARWSRPVVATLRAVATPELRASGRAPRNRSPRAPAA